MSNSRINDTSQHPHDPRILYEGREDPDDEERSHSKRRQELIRRRGELLNWVDPKAHFREIQEPDRFALETLWL
jgi:hypothetical protein